MASNGVHTRWFLRTCLRARRGTDRDLECQREFLSECLDMCTRRSTDRELESLEKCWVGGRASKSTKVELYSEVILWKTIRGFCAVFSEQDSSASQMTAAKDMDIISRPTGCAGQAPDAVSVYTQEKMEDAPKLLKISKLERADNWIRLSRHRGPKSWSSLEDPVVPLVRNLYGHPLAGLLWEWQFGKIILEPSWRKVSNWECLFVHSETRLFLSVHVDDKKMSGWKKHGCDVESIQQRSRFWENQIMHTWRALREKVK